MPVVVNSRQTFENFLEDWEKVFKPEEPVKDLAKKSEEESKEVVKEPKKEPEEKKTKGRNKKSKAVLQFEKLAEAYRIIRKYNVIDGWEIEKVFSAYCVRNNIPTEQVMEGF
jgi:hypothetical protein